MRHNTKRWLRSRPVTLLITAIVLFGGMVLLILGPHARLEALTVDLTSITHRQWWTFLTSQLLVLGWANLFVSVVALFSGLGWVEGRIGSLRTVIAFVVTGTTATLIGLGLQLVSANLDEYWAISVRHIYTFDPLTPLAGSLAWASASASPLWRRRIRVLLVGVAATLLLYRSSPAHLYLVISVCIGLFGGRISTGRPKRAAFSSSRHEVRSLLAAVTVVFAAGPIFRLIASHHHRTFAFGQMIFGDLPSRQEVGPCPPGSSSLACPGVSLWGHSSVLIGVQVIVAVLLLACAWGLLKGRRSALWTLVVLSAVAAMSGATRLFASPPTVTFSERHGIEIALWQFSGITIPVAFMIVLLWQRRVFPPRVRAGAAAQPRDRDTLLRSTGNTLSWMARWPGNQTFVTADHRNAVAYRAVNGFALTISDPFGAADTPEHCKATLNEFIAYCDSVALQPVFYSVHESTAEPLRQAGWSTLEVAEETILDPRSFTLSGKRAQDLRTAVNRAHRTGLRTRIAAWADMPLRLTRQITNISEEWVANKELPELSFTLGGLDELQDDDVLVAIVLDEEDTVLAITSWLPIYQGGIIAGRTLDVMRRRSTSPNGAMEYLIADTIRQFGEDGLALVSLSGSPLAQTALAQTALAQTALAQTAHAADSTLNRLMQLLSRGLEPSYGFRSLARFKAKFSSNSQPMYLAYRDSLALPAIGLALGRCYLPTAAPKQLASLLRAK